MMNNRENHDQTNTTTLKSLFGRLLANFLFFYLVTPQHRKFLQLFV